MKTEIEELEEIRARLTELYMKLGNPKYCEGDMVVRDDIERFKKKIEIEN